MSAYNQYLVMFELIRAAAEGKGKYVTVFTHSLDCISIAESQFGGFFEYRCMERIGNSLLINELEKDFFSRIKRKRLDSEGVGKARTGSLCAEAIMLYKKCAPSSISKELLPYLELVQDRDVTNDPQSHDVFHYRGPFTDPETGLSNTHLIEAIETFDRANVSLDSFEDRAIQKMYLLIALRVWVEKQLRDYYPGLFGGRNERATLGKMINIVFEQGPWRGEGSVTKEFLASKKTMLNQNAHGGAQTSPFDFAVNLSFDDICREIEDIVARFSPKAS